MGIGWTIIPNDWVHLERVINELGSRILDENKSFSDYVLVDGSRPFTGPVAGIDPDQAAHLATKNYVDSQQYLQESDMVGSDILERDTEVWVIVGPLISALDGTTPAQALVLDNITAAIYKGVNRTVLTLSASNFAEMSDGYVKIKLTVSDTDTQGRLTLTLRDDDVFLGKSREFWVK